MNRSLALWGILSALTLGTMAAHAQQPATVAVTAPANEVYLLSSFRGNGADGLHLAWSEDGLKWTALKGDKSFLQPQVGKEKLMRDPCILQGPDGTFHMVWTDSWTDRSIGYSSSRDLINWTPQKAILVMQEEPTARNCWAPEVVYDETKKQFLIFWSTTIPGRFPATENTAESNYNHRIYSTTTKDFETFTPTKLFYDGGFNVIDATIHRANNRFYLFVKDETRNPTPKKHLRVASSANIEGPFTELSEPFTVNWVEGPTVIKIGEDTVVYYDEYTRRKYGALKSRDLKTWENIPDQISLPTGSRHGTMFRVSRDVLTKLQAVQ